MLKTAITLSAVFMFVGCAGTAKQVQVKGNDSALVSLSGNWSGDYKGLQSGRSGQIKFNLSVGRHTADGEVLMYAKGANEPRALKIRFVRISDGRVNGKISPYVDPQCNCEVETEFLGSVDGDVIDGTFVTRIAALNVEQTGMWSVSRQD